MLIASLLSVNGLFVAVNSIMYEVNSKLCLIEVWAVMNAGIKWLAICILYYITFVCILGYID